MHTPTPGAQTPDPVESVSSAPQASQKVSAIPGLGTKIMAATFAAVGIAASAEKANGAVIVLNGLPNSTVSAPLKISWSATEANALDSGVNSRLFKGDPVVGENTSISRFNIYLNPSDIGSWGTLTITGSIQLSTSTTHSTSVRGTGMSWVPYDLSQQAQFGPDSGTMTTFTFIDSPKNLPNIWWDGYSATEGYFSWLVPFSVEIPISSGGNYALNNAVTLNNTSGSWTFHDFRMSYAPVPEPSTALLAGSALGAALLRRRRQEQKNK